MSESKRRILITGSADGLGLKAGQILAEQGHRVTLHARSESRAKAARKALPVAENVVVGDVSTLAGMRAVAEQANESGVFDAVIHNVAIGYREARRVETSDGIEQLFAINVVAPHVLTALITPPRRFIYLSSGLHRDGITDLRDPEWKKRKWNGMQAYSTSKLLNVVQAFAVARLLPNVFSNAIEPGWVATKMGGAGAPDDLTLGGVTQAWLAVSEEPAAKVTAQYFFHKRLAEVHPAAHDTALQDELVAYCTKVSGVPWSFATSPLPIKPEPTTEKRA